MPQFTWSTALTANQIGSQPIQGWQLDRVPWNARVQISQRATTVGVRTTIYSGTTTIVQRSPVQGGGTAGVTPAPLNTPVIEFIADAGDRLMIVNDEVAGGTPTVDGIIQVDPI